jgi:choline kinase
MKGIILCAGQGSRLLPLTLEMPKCLVKVQGQEILLHQLSALHTAGIRQAAIVIGYQHRQVLAFLERELPVEVFPIFNPFWSVASSIGSVWSARGHLAEPFCLMNGDTVFDASMIDGAVRQAKPGINLLVEETHDLEFDDMRVTVEAGSVVAVSKALPTEKTTHRSLGVILSNDTRGRYLKALDEVISATDGYKAFHHAVIARLAETAGVHAISRDAGAWQEIDRPEDIERWARLHREKAR